MFGSNFYLSNYQSNFAHLQTEGDKNVKIKSSRTSISIENPLIVPLGISIYDKGVFPSLECVVMDYKNVEYAFNIVRSYDIAHYNQKNQMVLKRGNNIKVSSKNRFKLRWNEKEIFEFNNEIYDLINDPRYNYDCLLYFISCHGDSGGVIYDSDGNEIPLITIFDIFSNQHCIKLRNKPKMYFIEACRGHMRTPRLANSNFSMIDETKEAYALKLDSNNKNSNCHLSLAQSSTSQAQPPAAASPIGANSCDCDEKKDDDVTSVSTALPSTAPLIKHHSKKMQHVFSKYNYNREIYANTEGYAVVEPGSKGGYMTRSIVQSIVNNEIFEKSFDEIMIHSRNIMLKLMGMTTDCGAQVIDDHNNIPNKIIFK